MEIIFQLSSLLVMPFWLLIIFLPHWQWTRRIMASPWVVAPAALLYTLLVVPVAGELAASAGKPPARRNFRLAGHAGGRHDRLGALPGL